MGKNEEKLTKLRVNATDNGKNRSPRLVSNMFSA